MAESRTAAKRKYKIEINQKWCKGCGICMALCPKGILVPEGLDQKASVTDPDLCINCKMCEVHCPDFAIRVVDAEDKE
jgi:2-oxoglutarate ferredoxin oxidoreductase subunit delta